MKTVDFLDAVKVAYCLTSDYQLYKKLEVSQATISGYRSKKSFLDDYMALKIADLLDVDPLFVLACAHAEREERRGEDTLATFWLDVANKSGSEVDILTKLSAA